MTSAIIVPQFAELRNWCNQLSEAGAEQHLQMQELKHQVLTEPDALDRSLLIGLDKIRPENRKIEKEILGKFDELRPRLLAYIFDMLTKAIQIKDTVNLRNLPRMADFALWGEAISRAMGYEPTKFIKYYYENLGKQNVEAVENHPLGHVLIRYITDNGVISGSPSEVLDALVSYAIYNRMEHDVKNKYWPKAANSLTRRLREISSSLLDGIGINVRITRMADSNMTYLKIGKIPPEPPEPPEGKNHEENSLNSAEDTLAAGDIISPEHDISPEQDPKNRAQNQVSGDTGDTGDTGDICQTIKGDPPSSDYETFLSRYEYMISKEYLESLDRWAYRCKEHPEVPYYSLDGIYVSHFKPEHEK
jgi:hypothetical protein